MITAVDTNVLLDVLVADPDFFETSKTLLENQSKLGLAIISPIAYSELLSFFLKKHEKNQAVLKLEEFLTNLDINILDFTKEDFNLAAEVWLQFLNLRQAVVCPNCGASNSFKCQNCGTFIFWRNHVVTDFLIGAHAQNHANVLLTRDKSYYKKYFKIRALP